MKALAAIVVALAVAQPATASGLAPGLKVTGKYRATLTAYSPFGCDRWSGGPITSMGTRVRPGVLAVQQGVFRLGTRVFFPKPLPGRSSRYYRIEDHIGWTSHGVFSLDVAVTCDTLARWRNPRVEYWTIR
jgi:3D (Asp-Asp-Asp) domain-containing protein